MHRGYIKLWRRIQETNMWLGEKFTRGQAWVDLLMLANHKDGYIRKRGIRVDLKRGDIGWSERELADRWKWSRDKVRRFLSELCSDNEEKLQPQTRPQKKNVTSCYSIINYNLYQDSKTTDVATNRPQTDHKQDQNKNEKNEKKTTITYPEWLNLELWKEFKKMRVAIKARMTPHAEKLAITKLEGLIKEGYPQDKVINRSIENSWKGLFPLPKDETPTKKPKEITPDNIGDLFANRT